MSVGLEIDRIVVEDAALVPGRTERLRALVAEEVRQLLERVPPAGAPARAERVRARPLVVAPESERVLARELAARIVEAIGGKP